MKIELDINDIISKEELRETAGDMIREHLKNRLAHEYERILSNSAYYSVYGAIDSILGQEQVKIIKEKTHNIIDSMSEATVFRTANYWEKDSSIAIKVIDETVSSQRRSIVEKVIKLLEAFDFSEKLSKDFDQIITNAIIEKLERKQ